MKKILAIGMVCVLFCGYVAYAVAGMSNAVEAANNEVISTMQIGHEQA